ncbi:histidinol dehydrogenase [Aeromicrobium sp.]|uniref:histidinol dehydrogenase n=1 Tax=Aeromicrobium sp. TaxID=1871063 RepID=UPI003D6C2465
MIRRLDLRHEDGVLPRAQRDVKHALEVVAPLCEDVRVRGEEAVLEYGERFDHVRPTALRVDPAELNRAAEALDTDVRAGLEMSIARLRRTCEAELEQTVVTEVADGATVERRIVPMSRAGLYVPGGLAPLVSTVVMNAVPAQVAGVGSIALASPPQPEANGLPHPTILAACSILGIDEVYAAGGAQALAMLAYGTTATGGSVEPVDLVTGPGNIYVAAAKRYLQGTVAIDSEAGPTEIAIIADDTADAVFVAADLISQAEHDPMAASVLVTDSEALADAVEAELERQVPAAKHTERIRTALGGRQSAIVLVRDIDHAVDVANEYAAEHLEIHTDDAYDVAGRIDNAGAIFVGPHTPVSLGDYVAGSNHVLPTASSARHSSGLSVRAFCKNVQVVTYTEQALRDVGDHVNSLSAAEDLPSHAAAVRARTEREGE